MLFLSEGKFMIFDTTPVYVSSLIVHSHDNLTKLPGQITNNLTITNNSLFPRLQLLLQPRTPGPRLTAVVPDQYRTWQAARLQASPLHDAGAHVPAELRGVHTPCPATLD